MSVRAGYKPIGDEREFNPFHPDYMMDPPKTTFFSRAYTWLAAKGNQYPKIRTFLVTLLVLGLLAAGASLGIHFGMTDGFAGLHDKIMALKYGAYIGMGAGAGAMLLGGGMMIGIHKLLNRKPAREENE